MGKEVDCYDLKAKGWSLKQLIEKQILINKIKRKGK